MNSRVKLLMQNQQKPKRYHHVFGLIFLLLLLTLANTQAASASGSFLTDQKMTLSAGTSTPLTLRHTSQKVTWNTSNSSVISLKKTATTNRIYVKAKKPVLGICRGMQLINVYFGGSLNQNIKNHRGRWHTVRNVGKNSWIYNLYKKNYKVYSSHHQSVKRLGKNLTITQKAPDGTVEALQHKTLPIYGVQWHPENMGKQGIPVFRGFIKICR